MILKSLLAVSVDVDQAGALGGRQTSSSVGKLRVRRSSPSNNAKDIDPSGFELSYRK